MKYLLISMLILLAGCAEFPIDVQQQQQLNCEPAASDGCAGWLPPKEE
jgi:hypothetical protein